MFAPDQKLEAQSRLSEAMRETKREMERCLPFAMDPVVYDFAINEHGTRAAILEGEQALLPAGYYKLIVPRLLQQNRRDLSLVSRAELDRFANACRSRPELSGMVQDLFDTLIPRSLPGEAAQSNLSDLLARNGFDQTHHEQIRKDLRDGRIGLSQNRLPTSAQIEDVRDDELDHYEDLHPHMGLGNELMREGTVAVVTLAAGAGSRWTQGAGVAKALHPFCKFSGKHRSFMELHLAKSRRREQLVGAAIPHIFTTSHLTHEAIAQHLLRVQDHRLRGPIRLSPGRAIGLRLVPTLRDLHFHWEESPQQLLDEQQQKVRESLRGALIQWARRTGEATDYTDNIPAQCLHPVGHWYEMPNLLRNGVLCELLTKSPHLRYLMLHNIDTVGADVDPCLVGWFAQSKAPLGFEVISRRLEDRGGGLARVNGQMRLLEGLAMPREEQEFHLRYYNSMTTWIDIDRLLSVFELSRIDLADEELVNKAIRRLAAKMPTYVTLKEVKRRWGHGQEDVYPVAQFEKLWGDMTALPEVGCRFVAVSRMRGQQLKDPAQLDGWLRDGSAEWVNRLCAWA